MVAAGQEHLRKVEEFVKLPVKNGFDFSGFFATKFYLVFETSKTTGS
jgi:hypothetical protein